MLGVNITPCAITDNNHLNYYVFSKERNIVSRLHKILFIKKPQEM